ncbi:MAG: phosphoadenosine phosphosulfate reductase family protein [Bacteroidota bacterium]
MQSTIDSLLSDDRCLVVCNHSGGKDSQAMYLMLREIVSSDRLVVIHAHLPEVEWPGIVEHISSTIDHDFYEVRAKKTFFEMVNHRGKFPSPANRQCTSDLKRGPIQKKIRHLCNDGGFNKVLNCMGLRAQESSARARKAPFRLVPSQTNTRRTWYEWLPIHELSTESVFQVIEGSGQMPHWAYEKGMSRLSCCFCIMSSKEDLRTAAKLRPELFQRYVQTERRLGFTMMMPGKNGPKYLDEIIADPIPDRSPQLALFTCGMQAQS